MSKNASLPKYWFPDSRVTFKIHRVLILEVGLVPWLPKSDWSLKWLPGSPDLTPYDFYLWGLMKNMVYETPVQYEIDLVARIAVAVQERRMLIVSSVEVSAVRWNWRQLLRTIIYLSIYILIKLWSSWLYDWLLEAVRTNPGYGMATLIYNNLLNLILGTVISLRSS